jgi:hypothetical protein
MEQNSVTKVASKKQQDHRIEGLKKKKDVSPQKFRTSISLALFHSVGERSRAQGVAEEIGGAGRI